MPELAIHEDAPLAASTAQAVVARARQFDVRALLAVLRELGYPRDAVRFRSNPENVGARTLIHDLQLVERPHRQAIITLNLGLLGANGLLPTYFAAVMETAPDPEKFYAFIGFFDHRLLAALFDATDPEREGGLFRDFQGVQRACFHMLGVASASTLHWLFALYFPELRVDVKRRPFHSSTSSHALRIGRSKLDGSSVVGTRYDSAATGFRVRLWCDEEVHTSGQLWAQVVKERLDERILPAIYAFDVPLMVVLHVNPHASWAELSHAGSLGYDRLKGDEESGHEIVVFHGRTGSVKTEKGR